MWIRSPSCQVPARVARRPCSRPMLAKRASTAAMASGLSRQSVLLLLTEQFYSVIAGLFKVIGPAFGRAHERLSGREY